MAWNVWIATVNTIHSEDDMAAWVSSDSSWGVAAVADGVSATSGGGASYLAVNSLVHACRLYGYVGRGLDAMRRCLDYVSQVARNADPGDIDVIELVKKSYYPSCSQPCTRPFTLDMALQMSERPRIQLTEIRREAPPSTTLLAALLRPETVAFTVAGDGSILGVTGLRSEDVWMMWGALPQFFSGSRLGRFLEVGRGFLGNPLVVEMPVLPGHVFAIATDGVDPAALAEVLLEVLQQNVSLERLAATENPAAHVLRKVLEASPPDDDATLALIEYTE